MKVLVSESSRKWARQLDDRWERWRIRRNINLPTIHPSQMRQTELKNYLANQIIKRDDLVSLKADLAAMASEAKTEIDMAKLNARNGNYLPTKRFKALQNNQQLVASKIAIVESQLVKHNLAFKRKKARERNISNYFMDVAREVLDSDIFYKILDQAEVNKEEATK